MSKGMNRYAGDLRGQKFGRLTVFAHLRTDKSKGNIWACVCTCGNTTYKSTGQLRDKYNKSVSCGCARKDSIAKASAAGWAKTTKFSHPLKVKIKHLWRNMVKRCHDATDKRFDDYGGRGITVCDEWRNDRYAFYKWCTENGIEAHLTIDRIENDGPYSPLNCKFSTLVEQANNTRKNVFVEWEGRSQTVAQWAREAGINPVMLLKRLRMGWPMHKALTHPARQR